MSYWGHQIARTKPFRDKIIASQENEQLQKIYKESWWFISYMFGMNLKSFLKHEKLINIVY
jgi:hypothetical protein